MYVEIYGTPSCKNCKSAKDLVESYGIKYSYTDVTDLEERANMNLRLKSPARSVPQIFVDNKHFPAGFHQLKEYLETLGKDGK